MSCFFQGFNPIREVTDDVEGDRHQSLVVDALPVVVAVLDHQALNTWERSFDVLRRVAATGRQCSGVLLARNLLLPGLRGQRHRWCGDR